MRDAPPRWCSLHTLQANALPSSHSFGPTFSQMYPECVQEAKTLHMCIPSMDLFVEWWLSVPETPFIFVWFSQCVYVGVVIVVDAVSWQVGVEEGSKWYHTSLEVWCVYGHQWSITGTHLHVHTIALYQEHMMTSFFIAEGGGRACNCQKFKTGRISRVY